MTGLRIIRWVGAVLVLLLLLAAAFASALWLYFHPSFTRLPAREYSQRHGEALVLEALKPHQPNGLGVLLLVSGGWKSGTNSFHPWMVAPLLRSGYTVIPIYHGDADTLVPLEQSQRYQDQARQAGNLVELVVHGEGRHGWLTMLWDIRAFATWFDRHLRPEKER